MTADPRGWHLHDFGSGRTVVHNESGLYVAEFLNKEDAEKYLLLRSMAALEDIRYQRWLDERDRDQRNYEAAEERIAREEWSR